MNVFTTCKKSSYELLMRTLSREIYSHGLVLQTLLSIHGMDLRYNKSPVWLGTLTDLSLLFQLEIGGLFSSSAIWNPRGQSGISPYHFSCLKHRMLCNSKVQILKLHNVLKQVTRSLVLLFWKNNKLPSASSKILNLSLSP